MASAHELDPSRSDLSQDEIEAIMRERLGPDAGLIEILRFGDQMRLFMETPVGKYLVGQAEEDLAVATREILDSDDLGSTLAQAAHFRARVARGLLRYIDEAIQASEEAQIAIEARDEADTERMEFE